MKRRAAILALLWALAPLGCAVHDVSPVRAGDGRVQADAGPRPDGEVRDGESDAPPTDGETPSRPCVSNSDCAADTPICTYPAGVCAAAAGPTCGLPPAPRASPVVRALGESCSFPATGYVPSGCPAPCTAGQTCETGLVCAPSFWAIKSGEADYQAIGGICLEACDACASAGACSVGRECYAMSGGGGFCHPSPLPVLGEDGPLGICATPPASTSPVSGMTCRRLCRPDDPNVEMTAATTSADCPGGELCTLQLTFLSGWDAYICTAGRFAAWGELCGGEPHKYCPLSCQSSGSNVKVCSPDCGSVPCPDGLGCFAIDNGVNVSQICIRDGVIPIRGYCAEDRNCQAGLRCTPSEAVPRIKSCLL